MNTFRIIFFALLLFLSIPLLPQKILIFNWVQAQTTNDQKEQIHRIDSMDEMMELFPLLSENKAEQLLQLLQQGTPESLQQVLIEFQDILPIDNSASSLTVTNGFWGGFNVEEREQILSFGQQFLTLFRVTGNRIGEARVLNNMALFYQDLGEPLKALDYLQEALPIWREIDDPAGEALTIMDPENWTGS